ncbi:efflux RND transporter periplasmic adaptor subunit [Francisella philomiragia]|uniref:efflux RND transporter periplasmic adaptor subunit n=1 Tax=Francisella philomiragia TaxID=28110 RepID=UPI001903A76A|nr:efflux RND transporter periplasmic adaptor subunit [Francisella philomiragia]MBK2025364.1 efflux RND transporter periplasmic adaptor subunit [Francisella philomiragia]
MKKNSITFIGLVILVFVFFYIKKSDQPVKDKGHLQPIVVEIENPKEQDSYHELTLFGKTSAYEIFTVKAKASGVIKQKLFSIGSFVHKGDLLLSLDTELIDYKIEIQREIYEIKQKQSEAMKKLVDKGASSYLEYSKFRLDYLNNKQKYYELLDEKEKSYILSPTNGIVEYISVSEGEYVTAKDKIATINDVDKIKISFDIEEDDYRKFKNSKESIIEAYIQSLDKLITIDAFETSEISQDANHSVHVEGIVSNFDRELLPGLFVKIKLFFLDGSKMMLVPKQAVFIENDQYYVYRYNDGIADKIPVNVDKPYNDYLQISSSLNKTDKVIIASSKRLYQNAEVTLEK